MSSPTPHQHTHDDPGQFKTERKPCLLKMLWPSCVNSSTKPGNEAGLSASFPSTGQEEERAVQRRVHLGERRQQVYKCLNEGPNQPAPASCPA